ncbi:hypothetical protein BDK51DRAFT_26383 [Blyttiomyces helicus]|uniref:Uncharacterized protein n=1 Tax=Blyttiomyces helicus TaxID=388810 RepID=A0A4P9W9E2_9FUNG|nr:hypothetical protein BDK51DRAFT_26383 [Blyttiomyces helicus]|eukprot:RKO89169.1 hypothetical protein BDK51DRAFT_26383 [Blyttiomyces helicus]
MSGLGKLVPDVVLTPVGELVVAVGKWARHKAVSTHGGCCRVEQGVGNGEWREAMELAGWCTMSQTMWSVRKMFGRWFPTLVWERGGGEDQFWRKLGMKFTTPSASINQPQVNRIFQIHLQPGSISSSTTALQGLDAQARCVCGKSEHELDGEGSGGGPRCIGREIGSAGGVGFVVLGSHSSRDGASCEVRESSRDGVDGEGGSEDRERGHRATSTTTTTCTMKLTNSTPITTSWNPTTTISRYRTSYHNLKNVNREREGCALGAKPTAALDDGRLGHIGRCAQAILLRAEHHLPSEATLEPGKSFRLAPISPTSKDPVQVLVVATKKHFTPTGYAELMNMLLFCNVQS